MRSSALHILRIGAALGGAVLAAAGAPACADAQAYSQTQAQTGEQVLFGPQASAPVPAVVVFQPYYTRVEACLAAFNRVRDSVRWSQKLSTPQGVADTTGAVPAPARDAARRCAAAVPAAAVAAADSSLLTRLWSHVSEDSVEAIFARRLATLSVLDTSNAPGARPKWAALMQRTLDLAFAARPRRVAMVERLLGDMARFGSAHRLRLHAYHGLLEHAVVTYDTSRVDRYATAILELVDSLPADGRAALQELHARATRYTVLRAMARGASVPLPSRRLAPQQAPHGSIAFWFRRPDSTLIRSGPRQLRLVVPLTFDRTHLECDSCYAQWRYALLRALQVRGGPALEITLVARTWGYFRNAAPLEPAAEAALLRQYFLDYLKLPGSLGVEAVPFTRRPAPDRRRVHEPSWVDGSPAVLLDGTDRVLVTMDSATMIPALGPLLLDAVAGWLAH